MRSLLAVFVFVSVARADAPKPAPTTPPKPASPYEGEGWKVKVDAPKADQSKLEVTVEARGGFHLNDDYPINFQVAPQDGVEYERARVDKSAATLAPCKDGEHACAARLPGRSGQIHQCSP